MYESPVLTELGKVGDITLAATSSGALDADFPAGTPDSELTFS